MKAEMLDAIAGLVTGVAWPFLVMLLLVFHRRAIARILGNLESLTLPGGGEVKFQRAVDSEVDAVMDSENEPGKTVTTRQLEAATRVAGLVSKQDIRVVRDQVLAAAREYDRVRASLSSGDERTKQMEKAAMKMRTLAYAAAPLIEELASGRSPGERLAATIILQVQPDSLRIGWLVGRFGVERAFICRHAALALLAVARVCDEDKKGDLRNAIVETRDKIGGTGGESDHAELLDGALGELGG